MRIVLTGGPGSGKTVISAAIARANPDRIVAVPEAATQVYSATGTRWHLCEPELKRQLQRRIYQLQIEQEERYARENPDKLLLLDRGTIDGSIYWPDGEAAYWSAMKTTLGKELARYDRVILLQSAAAIGIYDGSESNSVRFENAAEAIASSEALEAAWGGHSRLTRVAATQLLADKIVRVSELVAEAVGNRV